MWTVIHRWFSKDKTFALKTLCLLFPCHFLWPYCRQHTRSTAEGVSSGYFPMFSSTQHLSFCLSLQEPFADNSGCFLLIFSTVLFLEIPLTSEIKCTWVFSSSSVQFLTHISEKRYACFIVCLFMWERGLNPIVLTQCFLKQVWGCPVFIFYCSWG